MPETLNAMHLDWTILQQPEYFPQLPALAKRLGVEPNIVTSGVCITMKDGTRYDLFALVNAALDRLDN